MSSKFAHTSENPFHISVGAVLVSEEGKVLAHKMQRANLPEHQQFGLGDLEEVYILMRETLENNESLETALARGLAEEFGMEGELKNYLGSLQVIVQEPTQTFEKTTLYFHVALTKVNERPVEDAEAHSTLEWVEPEFLISKMKEQGVRGERKDIDESKILETYVRYK